VLGAGMQRCMGQSCLPQAHGLVGGRGAREALGRASESEEGGWGVRVGILLGN
jgi:hypothetical protein